ncbi:hypothetical protein [Thalassovita sp.]|uniref:hypothetical protein n=1 Tax=Thalassovita sp. TaxID=1979401 RepID=UPI002B2783E8|nr:hypothetical protein [Thalassovita sp.]
MTTDLEKVKAAWEIDTRDYEKCFDELMRTQPKQGEKPTKAHQEAVRSFWGITAHMLNQYVRTCAQHNHYLEPMPLVPLSRLALHCEELSNGIVPDSIEKARAPGRPMRWGERSDIARALFFLEAVEAGDLQCDAPVKTVAECFNVTKQTVRNWRGRMDELCKGQPKPHPNVIEEAMRHAGTRYSIIGRGAPSG